MEAAGVQAAIPLDESKPLGRGEAVRRWVVSHPEAALVLLLVVSVFFRVYRLNDPNRQELFDERYYVNAARVIIGLPRPPRAPYEVFPNGKDPNQEHPPLGKLIIAASIGSVGDNPLGWRLPSLLAGAGSIALLYGIVRTAGGGGWLGALAASLFAFDNLALVHSRLGTLDMMFVAFILLAAWFYLGKWPLGAGIACGLAALVKLTGITGVFSLLIFEAALMAHQRLTTGVWPRSGLRSAGLLLLGFTVMFAGGLWLLDLWLTGFSNPLQHLRFMQSWSAGLESPVGPTNFESQPWQWLYNETQLPYRYLTEPIEVGGQVVGNRVVMNLRGAMNPAIIGAASAGIGYALWRAWRFREPLALWIVAWVAGTYLPYYVLALVSDRIPYLYYFLPTLPAAAAGIALLFWQSGLPRFVTVAYLAVVLLGFLGYFPFPTFVS
jgi:predicted membrane-bound dolichyl-phosphate-mannose-protein mannosyltransferase